jgi:hypothetical protein
MGNWFFTLFVVLLSSQAFGQTACERIGGELIRQGRGGHTICRCRGTIVNPADPQSSLFCLGEVARLTSANIETMTAARAQAISCGDQVLSYATNPHYGCPTKWLQGSDGLIAENREGGYGVGSASSRCPDLLTARAGGSQPAPELERLLAHDPHYSLGAPDQLISSCVASAMPTASAAERANTVGEWYFAMNRIKAAEIGAIRALADVDAVLGTPDDFWVRRNENCWDRRFPETLPLCQQQASCAATPGRMQRLRDEVKETLPMYLELREARRQASTQNCNPQRSYVTPEQLVELQACNDLRNRKIQQFTEMMSLFEARQPWLASEDFIGHFNRTAAVSDVLIEDAIRSEYQKQKAGLRLHLTELQQASTCLTSASDASACRAEDVDKVIAKTPSVMQLDPASYNGTEGARHARTVNQVMDRMQCLSDTRGNAREGASVVNGFAIDAVVTVATVGVGTTFTGLLKAGQGLKGAASGFLALDRVRKLSVVLRSGTLAGSVMSKLHKSGVDVTEVCGDELDRMPAPSSDGHQCLEQELAQVSDSATISAQDCTLGAAMFALDLVPGVLSKFKTGSGASRSLLGRVGNMADKFTKYTTKLDETIAGAAWAKTSEVVRARASRMVNLLRPASESMLRRGLEASTRVLSQAEAEAVTAKLEKLKKEIGKKLFSSAKSSIRRGVASLTWTEEEKVNLSQQMADIMASTEGGEASQYLSEARRLIDAYEF